MKIEKELESKFRNIAHKSMVNLLYTGLALQNFSQEFFKKQEISQQQFNVLRILRGQYPEAASIGLIKERMLDKNSDASRIVERLRTKKLVSRKENKIDRRQKDVLITQKGLDLLAELDRFDTNFDTIFSEFSEKELKKLNKTLDKIRSEVKKRSKKIPN